MPVPRKAFLLLIIATALCLPLPPAYPEGPPSASQRPQRSTPPQLSPQSAPPNSSVLVPGDAFPGGVLTGEVIGPDDKPVPNTPVEIAGGVPVTLTGEVLGEPPPQPQPTPSAARKAGGEPPSTATPGPKFNCAELLAQAGQAPGLPPAGNPISGTVPATAPLRVLTDAAGRFALCMAPHAPSVNVNLPGAAKIAVKAVSGGNPSLPMQPPGFLQPGQVISMAGAVRNLTATQNNNSSALRTVGAWSPDGRQSITAFRVPPQAVPGPLNLSYTGSDGQPHQVQASVFKILRAFLDRSQLHSNQGATFQYAIQFASQTGQQLCVEMHSAGPVRIVQQPPQVIPIDSAGLGRFSGKIRATQVMPGTAVPFELTPSIHACGPTQGEQVASNSSPGPAKALAAPSAPPASAPSLTIALAQPPYTIAQSCTLGQPALVIHSLITNTGKTAVPAIPGVVLARDAGKPSWAGGASLPSIASGATAAMDIRLFPPSQPKIVPGTHRFSITALRFSSAPFDVTLPANHCSALVLHPEPPKILQAVGGKAGRSVIGARGQQPGAKNAGMNAAGANAVANPDNQRALRRGIVLELQLPVPTGLTSTTDPQDCFNHGGSWASLLCKPAFLNGQLGLIWNPVQQPTIDGYKLYRVDGGRRDYVTLQANGNDVTFYVLDLPPGGPGGYSGRCYAVTSYLGQNESDLSAAHCVGGGEVIQTATFSPGLPGLLRGVTNVTDVCNGINGGTNSQIYDSGFYDEGFMVGYLDTDSPPDFQKGNWLTHCWNNSVSRTAVYFDVSSLAGKNVQAARLKVTVDTTDSGSGFSDHRTSCIAAIGPGIDSWWQYTDWIHGTPTLNSGTGVGPDVAYDVTPIVQGWIQYGNPNFGLVLMGSNEDANGDNGNVACQTGYQFQVSLEVQYQ